MTDGNRTAERIISGDRALASLYRGRPYGRHLPFSFSFTGTAGDNHAIWTPGNAFFEWALLLIKGSAAADLQIVDTRLNNIIGFVQVDGVNYSRIDLGMAPVRSETDINPVLVLIDPVGVVNNIKGVVYGWEVTKDGYYRA